MLRHMTVIHRAAGLTVSLIRVCGRGKVQRVQVSLTVAVVRSWNKVRELHTRKISRISAWCLTLANGKPPSPNVTGISSGLHSCMTPEASPLCMRAEEGAARVGKISKSLYCYRAPHNGKASAEVGETPCSCCSPPQPHTR